MTSKKEVKYEMVNKPKPGYPETHGTYARVITVEGNPSTSRRVEPVFDTKIDPRTAPYRRVPTM
jgi:hypothetical protein